MGRSWGRLFCLAAFGLGLVQMSACSEGHGEWRSNLEVHYHNHHEVLEALVAVCEENPWLRRIDASDDSARYYSGANLSAQHQTIERQAGKALRDIGALALSCGPRGDVDGNPLTTVDFIYYSVGLGVAGRGGSIVYVTDSSRSAPRLGNSELEEHGYRPLETKGWYTVVN